MNAKDACYWIGLFVGLRAWGVVGIFQFLGALVIGVGCGYLAERVYSSGTGPPDDGFSPPPRDDDPYGPR